MISACWIPEVFWTTLSLYFVSPTDFMFQGWSLDPDTPDTPYTCTIHDFSFAFIEMILPISCISLTFVQVGGKDFKKKELFQTNTVSFWA